MPVASGSPAPKINSTETKSLLVEFGRAQATELKSIEHRFGFELKELNASQAARRKEWKNKEGEARRKFFAQHPKGSERRTYVQDFIQRQKVFDELLAEERKQRLHEYQVRVSSLKRDHSEKLKEFRGYLERTERPPAWLWPSARY